MKNDHKGDKSENTKFKFPKIQISLRYFLPVDVEVAYSSGSNGVPKVALDRWMDRLFDQLHLFRP